MSFRVRPTFEDGSTANWSEGFETREDAEGFVTVYESMLMSFTGRTADESGITYEYEEEA